MMVPIRNPLLDIIKRLPTREEREREERLRESIRERFGGWFVHVPKQPPPENKKPGVSLRSNSSQIYRSQSSELHWDSNRAEHLEINPGIGVVQIPSGTKTVKPDNTTTYTITATNQDGKGQARTQVTVLDPPEGSEFIRMTSNNDGVLVPPNDTRITYGTEWPNPQQASNANFVAKVTKVDHRGVQDFTLTHVDATGSSKKDIQLRSGRSVFDFNGMTVEGEWTATYVHPVTGVQSPATLEITVHWTTQP